MKAPKGDRKNVACDNGRCPIAPLNGHESAASLASPHEGFTGVEGTTQTKQWFKMNTEAPTNGLRGTKM